MVKNDKREIKQILLTLLSIPSPTGEEMAILSWLEFFLSNLNFTTIWQSIDEKRANLFAYRGKPNYLIATHVDTVPAWDHPYAFSPKCEGEIIWGRGAIDTKGQIAALLMAVKHSDIPCALAFFVDEEKSGIGSEEFKPIFPFKGAIVLEPTNFTLAIFEAGSIEFSLKINGKAAHGALPKRGKNAIDIFFEIYQKLKSLPLWQDSLFEGAGINIGKIEGGIDCQIVAETCKVEIDLPIFPGKTPEEVWKEIETILKQYPVSWEIKSFDPPWEISPKEKVVELLAKSVEKEMPVRFSGMSAWTDAASLIQKGIPTVVFGAGDLAIAHTKEEKIDIKEVLKLFYILKNFLNKTLALDGD
ncbi:MAG: M20/M25/M40 family metallo-hydrolase [Candidatus Desulfofervidus auxilii]|nr:M20/M25/M40 family metallo-hydrolase [Candidatus Desulfofervidus auxilii]